MKEAGPTSTPLSDPRLVDLLVLLRQHPGFPALMEALRPPQPLPRFQRSWASDTQKALAEWIFASGQQAEYDRLVGIFLTKPGE